MAGIQPLTKKTKYNNEVCSSDNSSQVIQSSITAQSDVFIPIGSVNLTFSDNIIVSAFFNASFPQAQLPSSMELEKWALRQVSEIFWYPKVNITIWITPVENGSSYAKMLNRMTDGRGNVMLTAQMSVSSAARSGNLYGNGTWVHETTHIFQFSITPNISNGYSYCGWYIEGAAQAVQYISTGEADTFYEEANYFPLCLTDSDYWTNGVFCKNPQLMYTGENGWIKLYHIDPNVFHKITSNLFLSHNSSNFLKDLELRQILLTNYNNLTIENLSFGKWMDTYAFLDISSFPTDVPYVTATFCYKELAPNETSNFIISFDQPVFLNSSRATNLVNAQLNITGFNAFTGQQVLFRQITPDMYQKVIFMKIDAGIRALSLQIDFVTTSGTTVHKNLFLFKHMNEVNWSSDKRTPESYYYFENIAFRQNSSETLLKKVNGTYTIIGANFTRTQSFTDFIFNSINNQSYPIGPYNMTINFTSNGQYYTQTIVNKIVPSKEMTDLVFSIESDATPIPTPSPSSSPTPTPSPLPTTIPTPNLTPTPTATPIIMPTPTSAPQTIVTPTPSIAPISSPAPTINSTKTAAPLPTSTPTVTPTQTPNVEPSPSIPEFPQTILAILALVLGATFFIKRRAK
jgi:hypothetical protein